MTHCISPGCETLTSGRTGLCLTHYRASIAPAERQCQVCPSVLGPKNKSGLCRGHNQARGRSPNAIASEANRRRVERTKARRVVNKISTETGVHKRDILGDYQFDFTVDARAVASVVMRAKGMSLSAIGRSLKRDHTSIRHLVLTFPARAARKPELAAIVQRLAA